MGLGSGIRAVALGAALVGAIMAQASENESENTITLEGRVVGPGVTCVQFRTDGGATISLENAPRQVFLDGQRFRVTGAWSPRSRCMQGRAFAVRAHDKL